MSATLQEALVNKALTIADLFVQNAALNRSLPDPGKLPLIRLPAERQPASVNVSDTTITAETSDTKTTNTAATAATEESPSPGATAAATVRDSLLRRAAPWLLMSLASAGIGYPAGVGLYELFLKKAPAEQLAPQPQDGSLLQWLQDRGKHLPQDQQWTR